MQYDYTRLGGSDASVFLGRTRHLLKLLGNPHRGSFKFIHVSGTAGKGSTVALLHEMIYQSGYKAGSFTSPFATTTIEKIKVNNLLINPSDFVRLTEKIKPAIAKMKKSRFGRPAYFECILAIAFLYFRLKKCQWVILEVGLGGAYDATNVITKSQVSAITNIDLDHTDILGKTRTKIAHEKMGIIKANSHFFTSETNRKLLAIFKKRCRQLKTRFRQIPAPRDVSPSISGSKLIEFYQEKNISLATAIAKHLKIPDKIINKAIRRVSLPCRFEIIQKNPLVILDGAHNPIKIKSVIHNLKNLTYDKLYIIFACGRAKNARPMLKSLAAVADYITLASFRTHYNHAKAASPKDLSRLISKFRNKKIAPDPRRALLSVRKRLKKKDALLITGSFYLAGELRKRWISESEILRKRKTC